MLNFTSIRCQSSCINLPLWKKEAQWQYPWMKNGSLNLIRCWRLSTVINPNGDHFSTRHGNNFKRPLFHNETPAAKCCWFSAFCGRGRVKPISLWRQNSFKSHPKGFKLWMLGSSAMVIWPSQGLSRRGILVDTDRGRREWCRQANKAGLNCTWHALSANDYAKQGNRSTIWVMNGQNLVPLAVFVWISNQKLEL